MQEKLKIGEILVRTGLIQEAQLRSALGEQARWGGRIGITLVKLGFLTEEDLVRALGSHFGIPVVRIKGKRIAPEVLSLLPADFADKHGCMPLFIHWENGMEVLYLGMEDPGDLAVLDDVAFRSGLRVRPVLVGPVQIRDAIEELYHGAPGASETTEAALAAAPPEDPTLAAAAPTAASGPLHAGDTPPLPSALVAPVAPLPEETVPGPPEAAATVAEPAPPAPVLAPAPPQPAAPVEPLLPAPAAPPELDPGDATQILAQPPTSDSDPTSNPTYYEQTFEPETDEGLPEIEVEEFNDDFESLLSEGDALAEAAELAAAIDAVEEVVTDSETSPDLVVAAEEIVSPGAVLPGLGSPDDAPELPPDLLDASLEPDETIVVTPPVAPVALEAEPLIEPQPAASLPPAPEPPVAREPPPSVGGEPESGVVPTPAPQLEPVAAAELSTHPDPEPPALLEGLAELADAEPVSSFSAPEPPTVAPGRVRAEPLLDPPAASLIPDSAPATPASFDPPSFAGVDPNGQTRSSMDAALDAAADGEAGGRPRQVATRDILRAVTQLLIDSGIFSREELVAKVKQVSTDRRSG